MRTFTCYDCDAAFVAVDRDDILNQLYKHYMADHHKIITEASREEKKAWMDRFDADWEGV